MNTPDIYLYANGALRLTRHGDRAGGTVLMHVASGQSFTVRDKDTGALIVEIEDWLLNEFTADRTYVALRTIFADLPKVA